MTKTIRFEAPPKSKGVSRSRAFTADTARQLQERPGEWGIIHTPPTRAAAYATAFQIRRGILANFRPGGTYEAVGRTVDGEYRVYARFVGENGEHA